MPTAYQETHTSSEADRSLVSVVLPTFNRLSMLRQAVDSVLNQTYSPVELIVIDDGSTDETREMLKAYEGKLTVLSQPRGGVSAARNAGILGCGLDHPEISLAQLLDPVPAFNDVIIEVINEFGKTLDFDMILR